jgi:signal transduction histidine kinase
MIALLMEISLHVTIIWLTAILIFSLGLVIYLGSNKLSSRAFAYCMFFVTLWMTAVGLNYAAHQFILLEISSRVSYFLGSTVAASFLYFFFAFPEDNRPKKILTLGLIIQQAIFFYLFLFTDTIIYNPTFAASQTSLSWQFGPLSFLFDLFFFGFFAIGIYILYSKYRVCVQISEKKNLLYMIWVIIVGAIPPSIVSILLPRFGYFELDWVGPVSEVIWLPILSYSIIKYRQMNVKVVVTEVLAIAMTAVFFINIFINKNWGVWSDILTFIAFIILTIYLLKGVLREARQKEQLKDLNDNLELKVAAQTVEIRKSYDLEKKARRDLEKLNETKDQFIMITQHHLRTPVTNIRWQIESMASGAFGTINSEIKEALKNTSTSVQRLIRIVDDFLSITALKVGTKILNISNADLLIILEDVFDELKFDSAAKHLNIEYPKEHSSWPLLPIDVSKMREVLLIVAENAVRYNLDKGFIKIKTRMSASNFNIEIQNTGVGIQNEDQNKIFTHLFHRTEQARTAHPMGMGVGLSVARAIVRAHHGEITLASEGLNKGAVVKLSLPLKAAYE